MRRTVFRLLIIGVVALIAVFVLGGSGDPTYRVDAIFDSAKGMVPGQLVKIAGARVGTVTSIVLAPGPTARIEMTIDRKFAPFHQDASCQILPEGLISEYFVECNAGTRTSPVLTGRSSLAPTVPLSHTAVPLSLQDVINIFSMPTDQRIQILINELGIATAGRGDTINAILRRANPTLTQFRTALSVVDAQNKQIAVAVGQTNQVLGELAQRSAAVRGFVDGAASVLKATAEHRSSLGTDVHLLPPLLDSLQGALAPVRRLTAAGTPLLGELHAAAPALSTFTRIIPRFTAVAVPAVTSLRPAASAGLQAIKPTAPVVADLADLASHAGPATTSLSQLLLSMRNTGAFEGLFHLVYTLAADAGSYDGVSHYLGIEAQLQGACILHPSGTACPHSFNSPGAGEIPVNDPAAGPQGAAADWPQLSSTPRLTPSSSAMDGRPNRRQLSALLSYLLR